MSNNDSSWYPSLKVKDVYINAKNKVYLWFLNKFIAKEDEHYGFTEPSTEWMSRNNKKFWIQPCGEEEMK